MAISHVNSTTFASSGTTDTSVTNSVPTGVADGDLLLWYVSGSLPSGTVTSPTAPTGWTLWRAVTQNGANSKVAQFYRIASSEPGSYTLSGQTAARWTGVMSAFRGVDQTTPSDTAPVSAGSASMPAITTVTDGAMVVFSGKAHTASGVTNSVWATTSGAIAGQITQTQGATTNDTQGVGYQTQVTAGAVTPNLTISSFSNTVQIRTNSALRPASTGSAAAGTASLALAATGASTAAGTGSAAVALAATGAATTPAAGTGALALAATGTARAAAAGTATLSLTATGTTQAADAGSAALALTASGTAQTPAAGTATITLAATGAATAGGTAAGTASITLTSSGAAGTTAAGAATLTLVASGGGRALVVGTASLSLAAAAVIAATAGGTAQIVLGATGTGTLPVVPTVTPAERTTRVAAEVRVHPVRAEDRTTTIAAENRTVSA